MLLKSSDIHTYYGNIQALQGISLHVDAGRDRHADRRQRRGQDHDAEHASAGIIDPRQGESRWTARRSRSCRRTRSSRAAWPSRRKGGASSPA